MRFAFFLAAVLALLSFCTQPARASIGTFAPDGVTRQFSFSGTDSYGTGSGTLTVKGTYDAVTKTTTFFSKIDNTSPYSLNYPKTGSNSPAITAWGFDTTAPQGSLLSWAITGKDASGDTVILGQKGASGNLWGLDVGEKVGGFKVDLLADNNGAPSDNAIHYGLYRPGALTPGPYPYYTQATLTLTLSGNVAMVFNPVQNDPSPFIRMQRVGQGGSLKLYGGSPQVIEEVEEVEVPEPATLAMWGLGLGLVGFVHRRRRTAAA